MNAARRGLWLLIGLSLVLVAVTAWVSCDSGGEPPTDPPRLVAANPLEVVLRPQKQDLWCWAASAEMCMEFLGKHVEQCDQASIQFATAEGFCCPKNERCNGRGWPEFDKHGFDSQKTGPENPSHPDYCLKWDEIKSQIDQKRPIAFARAGHMRVIYGYFTDMGGVNTLDCYDPLPVDQGDVVYFPHGFLEKPGGCSTTYYDITKRPGTAWLDTNPRTRQPAFETMAPATLLAAMALSLSPDAGDPDQPINPGQPVAPGTKPGQPNLSPKDVPPRMSVAVAVQPLPLKPRYTAEQIAQAVKDAVAGANPAASSGLKTVQSVAETRFKPLGFSSVQEARAAQLGDGFALLRVDRDDLLAFQAPNSLFDLLQAVPEEVIWSVISGGRVCSSVTTNLSNGKWEVSSYGAPNRIKGIAGARQMLNRQSRGVKPAAEYIIHVPALNVMLVAHQYAPDKVSVAPTADHPALGLAVRKPEPVAEVIPRLIRAAEKVDPKGTG